MKNLVVGLIILVILGVGGYYLFSKMLKAPVKPQEAGTQPTQPSNVFTSIKDALSKSLSLSCSYKNEDGTAVTTYIKAGAVRVISQNQKDPQAPGEVIIKDGKMYTWNDSTKKGFVYTIEIPKNVSPAPRGVQPSGTSQQSGADKQDSVLSQMEKFKDSCKPATVADSMFIPPTDVSFQDISALMKGLVPSVPTGVNSGNYQQYLQNMKQLPTGASQ